MVNKLTDDIYIFTIYLDKAKLSINAFLILDENPTLVETGTPLMGKLLAEEIEKMIGNVPNIFVTHEHIDHLGGIQHIVEYFYDANIFIHQHIKVQLSFMGIYGNIQLLKGGDRIKIGKREIITFYTPIETHGSVVYLLEPDGIIFTGDYFGQLYDDEWKLRFDGDTQYLIKKIIKFHEGLGYTTNEVKKYLGFLKKKRVNIIAPSHGVIIDRDVSRVVDKVINAKLKSERKGSLWLRIFGGF